MNPVANWVALMTMAVNVSNSDKEINVLAAYQNQSVVGCGPQATAVHTHVLKYVLE